MLLAVGLALWEVVTRRSNNQVERFGVHTIRHRSGSLSRIVVSYLSSLLYFHSFALFVIANG